MSDIGRRIRDLRTAKGMTLPQLADVAGVNKGYLWRIEQSGEDGSGARPSASTLLKIADALEVSVLQLVDEERGAATGANQATASVSRVADIPEISTSLQDFIKACKKKKEPLTEEAIWMLAGIRLEGRTAESVEDWEYIFQSIKRVLRT